MFSVLQLALWDSHYVYQEGSLRSELTCSKSTMETTVTSEICSKLTINTPEWHQPQRSGVFIIDFEPASHTVLNFLSLNLINQVRIK